MINLNLGDSLDAMRQMPDKAYSLAIVDPPYGIGEDGGSNHSRGTKNAPATKFTPKGWDKSTPPAEYFSELRRVSKHQIIWGGNYFIDNLLSTKCMIVWDKCNEGNDFADCELAWASFPTAVRKFTYRWNGMLQQDMKNKEKRIHPTQKPVALYKWLLKNYAKPGDKILDTHLGSASIALACHDMGFDLDGFEIDEDYYTNAVKRLESHQRQMQLFQPSQLAYP